MPAVVVDTHVAVWYLNDDSSLSEPAANALDDATFSRDPIVIPTIVLVELIYLVEKRRLPQEVPRRLIEVIDREDSPYELAPLNRQVLTRSPRLIAPRSPTCQTGSSQRQRCHWVSH
jgi:predicted nucleic acid-binding protein